MKRGITFEIEGTWSSTVWIKTPKVDELLQVFEGAEIVDSEWIDGASRMFVKRPANIKICTTEIYDKNEIEKLKQEAAEKKAAEEAAKAAEGVAKEN